jgi:hypothetical protein
VTLTIATTGPYGGSSIHNGHPFHGVSPKSSSSGKRNGSRIALVWLTIPLAGVLLGGIARQRRKYLVAGWCVTLLWLLMLVACGGALGGGGQPLAVTVSPPSATVVIGGQKQFTANQSVTWGVTGGNANGTIDANGLYTAPGVVPTPASVTVTATSGMAGASPGSATVTITNPAATVTVTPNSKSLYVNVLGNTWPAADTEQQFSAAVNNSSSQTVTWAVSGGDANGTIDANGLYRAPAVAPNPAAVTITATSTQAASPGSARVTLESATTLGAVDIQVTATAAGGAGHVAVVTLTVD